MACAASTLLVCQLSHMTSYVTHCLRMLRLWWEPAIKTDFPGCLIRCVLALSRTGVKGGGLPANIDQLLTGDLYSVDSNATVAEVVSLMRHKHISCVPVVDAGIAVGIMTERDVMRLIHHSMDMSQAVAMVMSCPVRTACCSTSIFDAYELLKCGEIRHLVVTRNGLAAGVLTHSDLMRAVGMFELLPLLSG